MDSLAIRHRSHFDTRDFIEETKQKPLSDMNKGNTQIELYFQPLIRLVLENISGPKESGSA